MNDLQPSDECVAQVKSCESLRLVPYVDDAGFTTWGWGHKGRPGELVPQRITEEDAEALIAADLNIAGSAVRRHVTVELTQSQFDGLVDFTFNLGEGALASSTMLHMVNRENFEAAAEECKLWDHAHVNGKLVELAGLKARRAWDAGHIAPVVLETVWTPASEIKPAEVVFDPNAPTPVTEVTLPPSPELLTHAISDPATAPTTTPIIRRTRTVPG
jgi:lysozyme